MTANWARHPVTVTIENGMPLASCEHRSWMVGASDWAEAMNLVQTHARYGDEESRFCIVCQEYVPTCDDYCLDCGHDT